MADTNLREHVREHYADAARSAAGCCSADDCGAPGASGEEFGKSLYPADAIRMLPPGAANLSLGCGNPTAIADLNGGETVLDLGSGGGIDVLLSAARVGPSGFAYGLDMTDEMLDVARKHAAEAGTVNVEFLKGYIEEIPLADDSVDVVISNCVINLSADKSRVFAEMVRVLRPGGRIGVSDVVAADGLTESERKERGSWVGCVAGALSFGEYEEGLRAAGFVDVEITPTHQAVEGMHSSIIKAVKPHPTIG